MSLKCHTVAPQSDHTHTAVLLHDQGSNGRDFLIDIMENRTGSLADTFPGVRWVFPNAGALWSARTSEDFRQWFESCPLNGSETQQNTASEQMRAAVKLVTWIVEDEVTAIGPGNVFLGGAGQGCTIAFHALLSHAQRLGGFFVTSAWCGPQAELHAQSNAAVGTPALLECSPSEDTLGFPLWAREFRAILTALGMCVERVMHENGRGELWKGSLHGHECIGKLLHRAMEL